MDDSSSSAAIDCRPALHQIINDIRTGFGHTRLTVVLALKSTIIRVIDGLPESSDESSLRQVIASTPFRYIPCEASNVVVSSVRICSAGEVEAAFVDLDMVTQVADVCRELHADLRAIVIASSPDVSIETLMADTASLFDVAEASDRYTLPHTVWRSRASQPFPSLKPQRAAVAAALILIIIAALLPEWRSIASNRSLHQNGVDQSHVALGRQRLEELTMLRAPLSRLHAISAESIHPLTVLADVGDAIDDGGRIVSFKTDSNMVQADVLVPDLVPLLRRLERYHGVSDVSLVGSIGRDSLNVGMMERALITFRYDPGISAQRPPKEH
jgi:hypothetical protein